MMMLLFYVKSYVEANLCVKIKVKIILKKRYGAANLENEDGHMCFAL
jgi:hypothetical protein